MGERGGRSQKKKRESTVGMCRRNNIGVCKNTGTLCKYRHKECPHGATCILKKCALGHPLEYTKTKVGWAKVKYVARGHLKSELTDKEFPYYCGDMLHKPVVSEENDEEEAEDGEGQDVEVTQDTHEKSEEGEVVPDGEKKGEVPTTVVKDAVSHKSNDGGEGKTRAYKKEEHARTVQRGKKHASSPEKKGEKTRETSTMLQNMSHEIDDLDTITTLVERLNSLKLRLAPLSSDSDTNGSSGFAALLKTRVQKMENSIYEKIAQLQ